MLYRVWGVPFFLVVERLLGIINLNHSSSAEGTSLAFKILPGPVGAYFLSRNMPITDFLNGLLRDPAFADDRGFPKYILAVARAHAHTLIALRFLPSPLPLSFLPLTVSAGDVMAVLEKLLIGAAAGASGWTYAAIFFRNGDYSARIS